jgi:LacI family transcriptional regulator
MSKSKVSLRAIAQASGVHQSTVSRVLKNDPRISKSTATKVRRVAKRLGYIPNPELGRLMAHMRSMRTEHFESVVALLTPEQPFKDHYSLEVQRGVMDRCKELGFIPEKFSTGMDPTSIKRLNRILKARGIEGVLVIGRERGENRAPALDMDQSSVVSATNFLADFPVHTVLPDHFANFTLVYQEIVRRKCKRPGLLTWPDLDRRQRFAGRMTHYQFYYDILGTTALPPYSWIGGPGEIETSFKAWFNKHQPDALLFPDQVLRKAIEDILGAKKLQKVFLIGYCSNGPDFPGIDQQPEVIGRSAVDILTSHMQRYEKGWPEVTKQMNIPGCIVLAGNAS